MKSATKHISSFYYAGILLLATLSISPLLGLSLNTSAPNPLENTAWKGTVFAPDAIDAVLKFKKDSMLLYYNDEVIETSVYHATGSSLTLKKLNGKSPCGEDVGEYQFKIDKSVLKLTAVKDDCGARSSAFSPDGYQKQ